LAYQYAGFLTQTQENPVDQELLSPAGNIYNELTERKGCDPANAQQIPLPERCFLSIIRVEHQYRAALRLRKSIKQGRSLKDRKWSSSYLWVKNASL
jgi:hypothetical protein